MTIPRPCPIRITCPEIYGPNGVLPDVDSPLANISSEAPDPIDFVTTSFRNLPVPIKEVFPDRGRGAWTNGFASSTTSQQDSDKKADKDGDSSSIGTIPTYGNTEQICSSDCPDGSQFVKNYEANQLIATTQAHADALALSECEYEAEVEKICFATDSLPNACSGGKYFQTIIAYGGTPRLNYAYTWEVIGGAMPPGITLDCCYGQVSGTPTAGGSYTFVVKITDAIGSTQTKAFTITVLEITTTSLPNGLQGTAYTATLAVSGGVTGAWSLVGNSPPNLTIDSATGVITGVPSLYGLYNFTARFAVGSVECEKDFSVRIWYPDGQVASTFGFGTIPFSAFITNSYPTKAAGDPFDVGLYKVIWDAAAPLSFVWQCTAGAFFFITAGSGLGDPGGAQVRLAEVATPILGYTNCHAPSGGGYPGPEAALRAQMIAYGSLLDFELTSSKKLTCQCPSVVVDGTCLCPGLAAFVGGNLSFQLIMVGRLAP